MNHNGHNGCRTDESINTIGAEGHGHGIKRKIYRSIVIAYLRRRWHKGIAKESWSGRRPT